MTAPTEKRCTGCGRTLPITDFHPKRRDAPDRRRSQCKECTAAYRRARRKQPGARERDRERKRRAYYAGDAQAYAERLAKRREYYRRYWSDPAKLAARRARWRELMADPEYRARKREYQRESQRLIRQAAKHDPALAERLRQYRLRWLEGVKSDPDRYAAFMEGKRIGAKLRVIDNGAQPRRQRNAKGAYKPPSAHVTLDVAPFRDWIVRTFDPVRDQDTFRSGHGTPYADICRALNLNERRLYDVLHYRTTRIRFDLVDQAFCSYGDPWLLNELYPYDEADAA